MSIDTETMVEVSKPLGVAQVIESLARQTAPSAMRNKGRALEDMHEMLFEVGDRLRKFASGTDGGGIFGDKTEQVITEVLDDAESFIHKHANHVFSFDACEFDDHADCERNDDGECADGDDCDPDPYGDEFSRWYSAKLQETHEDLVKVANKAFRANDKFVRDWNKANPTMKVRNANRNHKVAVSE